MPQNLTTLRFGEDLERGEVDLFCDILKSSKFLQCLTIPRYFLFLRHHPWSLQSLEELLTKIESVAPTLITFNAHFTIVETVEHLRDRIYGAMLSSMKRLESLSTVCDTSPKKFFNSLSSLASLRHVDPFFTSVLGIEGEADILAFVSRKPTPLRTLQMAMFEGSY